MKSDVLKLAVMTATLAAFAFGCSGGAPVADLPDGTDDTTTDTMFSDAHDTVVTNEIHEILEVFADTDSSDALPRDNGTDEFNETVDPDVPDSMEDQESIEPDIIDDTFDVRPDIEPDTTTDAETDTGNVYECMTDEDCVGKVTLKICQTAWCNDDNLCAAKNKPNDTECDDNRICTENEKCLDGECIGSPVDCSDGEECTQDLCDEANFCYYRPYYGPCNDGNACTENDSCATGTCIGTSIDCDDGNTCTSDSCDPASGCVYTKLSGIKCDDGDLCTTGDVCAAGVCSGTFNCDDGNPCTFDGCNELGCTHDGQPFEGDFCTDGLICTENDSCRDGVCTGDPVVCDDDDVCTDDYCLEGTGCKTRFNTASCDDGNPCTRLDRCQIGICKGATYSCPVGTCMESNVCDGSGGCIPTYSEYGTGCAADTNDCTDDICNGEGSCIHPNSEIGTACDDEDLCTQTDTCSNGVCVGNDPVECPVSDPCSDAGTCDPATGTCTLGALPEGSACSDGDRCTRNDKCVSGTCTGTLVVCPPISDCHDFGTCNPDDGTCIEVFKADGETCDDDNLCTQSDTCQQGICTGSDPVVCVPLDECHVAGICNPGSGNCSNPVAANNTPCDDQELCTTNDVCTNGSCAGSAYSCNDNKSCTIDICDGVGGCTYDIVEDWCFIENECRLPGAVQEGNMCMVCNPDENQTGWFGISGGFCDDHDSCTIEETCVSGECIGTAYSCDDDIDCTIDTCDGLGGCINDIAPSSCLIDGVCYLDNQQNPNDPCQKCAIQWSQTSFSTRLEGEACDDGDLCTWDDQCTGGVCAGTEYSCDDGVDCTADSCAGDGTCTFVAMPGFCYIDETCIPAETVEPGNACAWCNPSESWQFWTGYRENEPCDDGSLCTDGDKCASGVCSGNPKCDDEIGCTDDSCDELTGACQNVVMENYCAIEGECRFYGDQKGLNQCLRCIPPDNNRDWTATDGLGCDDSDACTVNDACVGEMCMGTPMVCDDGLTCTDDFCQYGLCGSVPLAGWCVIEGACVETGTVSPDSPCLICDPEMNPYRWSYNNFVTCDDEDDCSMDDICFVGMCAGQTYDCTDGIPCTTDTCDGLGGCSYSVVDGSCLIDGGCYDDGEVSILNGCLDCDPGVSEYDWSPNDGAICDDGLDCTMNDICGGGSCAGTSYDCDDGLVCTADACNGDGTCTNERIAGWCLINGSCVRDQTPNPDNVCEACFSSTNGTGWSANNGLPCDDGELCTKIDTCAGGACVGTQYTCDDGLICTSDACDGDGGCEFTPLANYCLIDFKCYSNNAPNPDNICLKCSYSASPTSWTNNDGMFCNDFNSCTVNDTCAAGECGGQEYSCEDGIVCTLDLCDGSGGCSNPLSPDACIIDGTCYWEGESRPGIPCEACVPDTSQSEWTELNPGAIEICNGIDDNCDGIIDPENSPGCVNYYADADLDGVGVTADYKCLCEPSGVYKTIVPGDCDDNEPLVYDGRAEECDGLDNDCDGVTDPDNTFGCLVFYADEDDDDWGDDTRSRCLCSASGIYTTVTAGDCDDQNQNINPSETEVCNGIDDNCDGRTDPPKTQGCTTYYVDSDGDGFGDPTVFNCLCEPTTEFHITNPDDCDDFKSSVYPGAPETCNDIDDDCSGVADDAPDEVLCPYDPELMQHGSLSCVGTCVMTCDPADPGAGEPAWYNVDGNNANGCECQGDELELTHQMSSSNPFELGILADDEGLTVTQEARLNVPGNEDWFVVTATDSSDSIDMNNDCDAFNFRIGFAENPNEEFEMDIYKWAEIEGELRLTLLCDNVDSWDFSTDFMTGGVGECPCNSSMILTCTPPESYSACVAVHGAEADKFCGSCPSYAAPGANLCSNNTQTVYVKVRRKEGVSPTCSNYTIQASNGAE